MQSKLQLHKTGRNNCRHSGQWKRRGRRCSRHRNEDSPAALGADMALVRHDQLCPVAHGGPWWNRAATEDPTPEQENAFKGGCNTIERPWLGSWQELWTHGGKNPHWNRFAARTCDPLGDPPGSRLFLKDCMIWEGPPWENSVKNCSPFEGLTLDKFMDNLPWNRPHSREQGNSMNSLPLEE